MNYKIIGKYIKEVNFKIPNPKAFFSLSKNIVNYRINIDIKSNQIKRNIIEVLTSLQLIPTRDDFEKINTKIVFSAVVELLSDKIDKSEMDQFKMQRNNYIEISDQLLSKDPNEKLFQ